MYLIFVDVGVCVMFDCVCVGEVVCIEGFLVDVSCLDGWYWNSLFICEDIGNGVCELVYVELFIIECWFGLVLDYGD